MKQLWTEDQDMEIKRLVEQFRDEGDPGRTIYVEEHSKVGPFMWRRDSKVEPFMWRRDSKVDHLCGGGTPM